MKYALIFHAPKGHKFWRGADDLVYVTDDSCEGRGPEHADHEKVLLNRRDSVVETNSGIALRLYSTRGGTSLTPCSFTEAVMVLATFGGTAEIAGKKYRVSEVSR